MDKYTKAANKHFKPKRDAKTGEHVVKPFDDAQLMLTKGVFAKEEREQFFTEAYAEIMMDYFKEWLKTAPHCTKEREFLYHSAMALGDVRSRLIAIETLGHNAGLVLQAQEDSEEESE